MVIGLTDVTVVDVTIDYVVYIDFIVLQKNY